MLSFVSSPRRRASVLSFTMPGFLLICGAACFASGFEAPPPPEALRLLDLLAAGEANVDVLREIVGPSLDDAGGARIYVGFIIREAIHRGVLKGEDVQKALALEGCPPAEPGTFRRCTILLELIWPHADLAAKPQPMEIPSAATPQATLAESRAAVLAARADLVASSDAVREPFVRSLLDQGDSTVGRAIQILALSNMEELESPADREAVRRFVPSATPEAHLDRRALWALQRDVLGLLHEKLKGSVPDPALVAEVRAVPPELAERGLSGVMAGSTLGHVQCIFEAWRKGETPPNEWQAWKEQLLCVGWF